MYKKIYIMSLMLAIAFTAVAQPEKDRQLQMHMGRGVELLDAGRYRAANAEFTKARKFLNADTNAEAVRLDYLLAVCAGRLDEQGALDMLYAFQREHPNSLYSDEVRFAIAARLYGDGKYAEALREYTAIDNFNLPTSFQDEYNFKRGHSLFMLDDYVNSYASMQVVGRDSEYTPHARYYIAYINYVNGNYAAAKREFAELRTEPAYAQVIPFYLLQIEYLQGNYDYVLREGDALLEVAEGDRRADIARIMAETWFVRKDYAKVISYMDTFAKAGGQMGRDESYMLGFSQYMYNDIAEAIRSLTRASGPDDQLTQNASYHLGASYLRMGDKRGAMQAFSMAASAGYDPDIRENALFNYGKLQYELGGGIFNEAINVLNRYIAEYPNSPRTDQAREYLISAYYNSNDYQAAYEAIKQMPNPDNNIKAAYQRIAYFRALEFYNNGEYDRAYTMFDESLRNRFNSKYTALTQFWKAEILYRRGDYRRAVPLYKEYTSLAPAQESEYKMALYNLGYSYFNQQQWSEAHAWFDRFFKSYAGRDNYRADAMNRVGDIYYAQRDFQRALDNYDSAAGLGTAERYYSQYSRAMTLGLLHNNNAKIEALSAIISSGQGEYVDDALYELGATYISMDRFADAAVAMRRYVADFSTSEKYLAALSQLGLIAQNMGENVSALQYYKQVIDKAPSSPEARDAMLAVRSIYVETNDVESYFAFAEKSGMETDLKAVERDSLAYSAAEKVYLSGDANRGADALKGYAERYPRGVFLPNALYYMAESYTRTGLNTQAIESLAKLSEMYYNPFTVRGLEKLSSLCYSEKRYAQAAATYRKLAATAVNPETVGEAWTGYVRSTKAIGDDPQMLAAADEVLAATGVPAEVAKQAKSMKAGVLMRRGEKQQALALYRDIAGESRTAEGAEASYYVIEAQYENGDLDGAEKAILDFAGQNTQHTYWLGRSFLLLGDIYVKKDDNFQARATLQSIVDGYSPADDGIIEAARTRINELK